MHVYCNTVSYYLVFVMKHNNMTKYETFTRNFYLKSMSYAFIKVNVACKIFIKTFYNALMTIMHINIRLYSKRCMTTVEHQALYTYLFYIVLSI